MSNEPTEAQIRQLENYVELWKQFSHYLQLAESGKYSAEDEAQFLEVKSLLTQELELVLTELEGKTPPRSEIHALIANAPSLRFLGEARDDSLRTAENQWHKLYIGWQALLGQLKAKRRVEGNPSIFKSLFRAKQP